MGKDYYTTLEINRSASDADIKQSYRRLALKYHPQNNNQTGASEKFNQLAEAYDVLSDPRKKATYDKFGEEGLRGGIPPESAASGAWSSGYTYHGNPEKTFREFFGGDNPFADFHTSEVELSFGGLRGREVTKQDPPIERDLHLALEDLFHGCTKKIKISRRGPNSIPADIIFIVRQKPHPLFVRQNNDLIYTENISLEKLISYQQPCTSNISAPEIDQDYVLKITLVP
ncbi:hypothetical protein QTP86_001230 [Hemibagrus guttatus]|nr:hypothetical protein QTP86_001230 [Hemibagrus guttatus]